MSYYPDPEARTDPRLLLIQRAERGAAARARQSQRWRRIATVAIIVLALVAGASARSWAHTIDVATRAVCVEGKVYQDVTVNSQNGDYRFAGAATDSEGHSVPVTIPAGGASVTVRLGPVSGPGGVRVLGDFYKANGDKAEHMDRSVRYRFLDDCKPPPPPPPPPPPAKQGSAGVTTTCDSVTFNFTGASPGVEQYAKVDGKVRRPATLNGSVTFKGLAPGEHPSEYGSGTNVQRGSFEALDCTPGGGKGDDFAGTATDLHRDFPPDQQGPPPPIKRMPGPLPFTDNNRNGILLAFGSGLFVAGLLLLALLRLLDGRQRYQRWMGLAAPVKSSWGETRVRPDRDSADTNLLMTLFHRFYR